MICLFFKFGQILKFLNLLIARSPKNPVETLATPDGRRQFQGDTHTTVGSTTDQMGAATSAIVRALRVRTVACSELHGSLLMQTVYHASGVYSERSRLSLVHIHTRC
jgi:hypothetical protein